MLMHYQTIEAMWSNDNNRRIHFNKCKFKITLSYTLTLYYNV